MEDVAHLKTEVFRVLAAVKNRVELETFRVAYLGRKGKIPLFLRSIVALPPNKRRGAGIQGNALRNELEEAIQRKEAALGSAVKSGVAALDVSRPGKRVERGHAHVLSQTLADAAKALASLGFTVAEGPELESEWYNFDALNMPKDHPARDMQETFWLRQQPTNSRGSGVGSWKLEVKKRLLLRTQTSNVQVRWMEKHTPPLRICCPGRCFRRDATDATHDTQFTQIEMLYVDRDISVAHLKYVVERFLTIFFKKEAKSRLRPSYFPFVEPGFEFDMACFRCGGKKCDTCKQTGWIELGGAGMVNQAVFEAAGYARGEWQGMAFGFGLERLAMLKYRIPDVRLFTGGDLRFIEQF